MARIRGGRGWRWRGGPIRTARGGRTGTPRRRGRGCWPARHDTGGLRGISTRWSATGSESTAPCRTARTGRSGCWGRCWPGTAMTPPARRRSTTPREAEELAAARARVAAQHVERVAAAQARAVGRAAVGGAGHTAATGGGRGDRRPRSGAAHPRRGRRHRPPRRRGARRPGCETGTFSLRVSGVDGADQPRG